MCLLAREALQIGGQVCSAIRSACSAYSRQIGTCEHVRLCRYIAQGPARPCGPQRLQLLVISSSRVEVFVSAIHPIDRDARRGPTEYRWREILSHDWTDRSYEAKLRAQRDLKSRFHA